MATRYWIIVASKDHVARGVAEGFAQACHGKSTPLKRMGKRDKVVYYSSKAEFGKTTKCQAFTAIGEFADDVVYQADMGAGFTPFRRNVCFFACQEVSILPLIPELSFISNKRSWGAVFRFGLLEIPQTDYELIAGRMLSSRADTAESLM
jgi:hypothetical protein